MLAQKRREERQQKDLEQKREMMLKLEETSKASSRAAEERLREEREKQKLRYCSSEFYVLETIFWCLMNFVIEWFYLALLIAEFNFVLDQP